jgi:23S rRNA (cytidine1920-2'-O)/16S rRNA (cytidine1409-2'-O)-methyltransferase
MQRRRADVALVEAGLFASREQARAAVLAGRVRMAGVPLTKAGTPVPDDVVFEVEAGPAFVSRGGVKLAGALDTFGIDVTGAKAVDVGASTGGFTDCLLQRGAASVTAVDVGYGQLAWKLREDPRVRVVERTNIRHIGGELPGAPFGLAVIDVSFVGLAKVLPAVAGVLTEDGAALALVKPQFEAGKGRVGRRGVVREAAIHTEVLRTVADDAREQGWQALGLTWSPIAGPEGNIEFWMWLAREGAPGVIDPDQVVRAAHEALGGR